MALPDIESFMMKISSLLDGNPSIGINDTKPVFKSVLVGGPNNEWQFQKQEDGSYTLSIGGYPFTGMVDGKVVVSLNSEDQMKWCLTFSEPQIAFIISPQYDRSIGWTVIGDNSEILVKPIIATRSIPPIYSTMQLFKLESGIY